ncbi:site-specific integrase [Rhizobium sp. Root482]|uniref:site-specific integrase n=1 Tax=Rhizobium sp. Root482 TaxID=1736543 RepID=UPI0006F88120|nr:site-specific integrase [Rhizobium sp. Root482]
MEANEMKLKYVVKRGETYSFKIAVPTNQRTRFGRAQIWEALGTADILEATARSVERARYYRKLFGGAPTAGEMTPETVAATAVALGMKAYTPAESVLNAEVRESLRMLSDGLMSLRLLKAPKIVEVAAVGGVTSVPPLPMTIALERFKELSDDKWMRLRARERTKKLRPYEEAVERFVSEMGDLDILSLRKRDAFAFSKKLTAKVAAKELLASSANKKLMWLKLIVGKVYLAEEQHDKPNPFEKVKIEHKEGKRARPPFTEGEIKLVADQIAKSNANGELKAINAVMQNTGATSKEICLLMPSDIFLNAPVPYIRIADNEMRQQVKSGGDRHRDIPLVGRALDAMRRFSGGFPKYRRDNGSEVLSASSNKIVRQVVDKTTYSYRHRMADRLRQSGCEDTLKNAILGHESKGFSMHYGLGFTLENKRDALVKALGETV